MISFLMSLMCITGLHQKSQCPTQTPISSHQLEEIWNPTNPYEYKSQVDVRGYYITSKRPVHLKDLRGRTLKIAVIIDPPYVNGTSTSNVTGDAMEVLTVLRDALEFVPEIVTPSDGLVGMYDEKARNWSGIMGMLVNGEADLSIHMMSMLQIRMRDVRFSRPLGSEKWVIMMRRPDQTTDGDGLTIPFKREVWYCLLVLALVMCPLKYIMVRIRSWACRSVPRLADGYSFGHCIWFVYGALLKQGSVLKPVADSTRILFVSWWLFITIMTGFYTANLTAYLTLSKVHIPYNGLGTIGYRKYWTARQDDTIHQVLAMGPTPNRTTEAGNETFYKLNPAFPEFMNLRWGFDHGYGTFQPTLDGMVERVRKRDELLFDEENRVARVVYDDFLNMTKKHVDLTKRCRFMKSTVPILELPYGFAFNPKTADEILPVFGLILDKMAEFGMWDYYRSQGLPMRDPCDKDDKDFRERKMRSGDLMKTYILCGIGYGISFLTFLLEQLHRCFFRPKAKVHFFDQVSKDQSLRDKVFGFYKGKGSGMMVPAVQTISVASAAITRPDAYKTEYGNGGLGGLQPAYYTYGS